MKALQAPSQVPLARAVAAALFSLSVVAGGAHALPLGEQVTAGAATVQRAGASLTVNQSTPKAAINWQAFGIGPAESVRFNQPNAGSIALNRVLGQDPTVILGALSSNGQVFILNPNGVLFGSGAQVNVGGLIASSLNLADPDFMAGRYAFTAGAAVGGVTNQATIVTAAGGYVAMIAPQVINAGSITAQGGTVALVAAGRVTLTLNSGSLLGVSIEQGTLDALVENKGAIRADGGQVLLTARAMDQLARSVVNNSGIIEAGSLSSTNGIIRLEGGEVRVSGVLSANGIAGPGGRIAVTGDTAVTIEPGAMLSANATGQGDGGAIVVWSDGATRVSGSLEAKGAGSGNGGMIETSGHFLDLTGIAVNASAPFGAAGTWLLDPFNLTVSGAATSATVAPAGTWTSNAGGSVVLNADINTALNAGTSVVLQTSGVLGDGFGNGDITVSAAIAKTAGANASLTLKAAGSIIVGAGISSTVGAMAVTLDSNTAGGGGFVNVSAPITTNGGALVIGGGATPLTGAAVGTAAQASGVLLNFSGVLNAGGGDITINGIGRSTASASNFGISQSAAIVTTGTGNITLNGTGGGTGTSETGVVVNTTISAGTGNISISGASSATGTILSNHGVNIAGGTTSTNGSGTITIDGTAAASTGVQSYGVVVQSVSGISTVRAADGLISVTGRNIATGSGIGNNGVYIKSPGSSIQSTGSGGVTVLGFGGGRGSAGADYGVFWDTPNAIQSAGTGAITITGTGGDAGGSGIGNYGVYVNGALTAIGGAITITGTGGTAGGSGGLSTGVNITAPLTGSGGAISITGTGGNSRGTGNSGITQTAAITNAGSGSIILNGTGGGTGTQEIGILSNADITAGTGDLSVTGVAGATAVGSSDIGVQFLGGTRSTAGAGTITIAGTASGTGSGANAYGVSVVNGAVITAVDGLISVTGTNNSSGSGGGNNGVYFSGAGSTIRSTGSGSISITGTPGSTASGTNYGIFLNSVTDGGGTLTLNSTGAVTSAGAITAANLALLGAGGSHVLTDAGNAVGILAANTGSVNFADNGDLVIGTVGTTAGVTATGTVLATATGNITLASGAGVSAGGTGNALVLASTSGGEFFNNAGPAALSAANGRWLVYANSTAGSFENGLTAAAGSALPRLYGRTYAANGPASIAEPGNHLVYAQVPVLTLTAENAARPYGDPNPAFSYTWGGFVADDGVTDTAATIGLGGTAVLATSATGTSNVGTYAINAARGTLTSGAGYGFSFVNGMLTVDPRGLTVTADDMTRDYGDPNPPLTAQVSIGNLVNGDRLSGNAATVATRLSNVGPYAITQGTLTAGGNYALAFSNGTLTVGPRGITITADDKSRTYGDPNPALTQRITSGSLAIGDSLAGAAGTAASVLSNAGAYAITQGTVAAGANYVLTFVNGNLAITPRPLSVMAIDQARVYGDPNPAFASRITAGTLVNGDSLGGSPATAATPGSNVGTYAIAQGSLANPNYAISFTNGRLTVSQRAITVTANDQTKIYGDPDLLFTFSTSDLGAGAPLAGFLGRTAGEEAGAYAINAFTPTGAGSANYLIGFIPATLDIAEAAPNGATAPAWSDANYTSPGNGAASDWAIQGASCTQGKEDCEVPAATPKSYRIAGSGMRLPAGVGPAR